MPAPVLELEINGRFVRINRDAVFDKRLSHAAYRVLGALSAYAGKGNRCWPGTRRIAADIRMDQANVVRLIRKLRQLGYVMASDHQTDGTTTSQLMAPLHHPDGMMPSQAMVSDHQSDVISPSKVMVSYHQNYNKELESGTRARVRARERRDSKNGWKKAEPPLDHIPGHFERCQCPGCERLAGLAAEYRRQKTNQDVSAARLREPTSAPDRP